MSDLITLKNKFLHMTISPHLGAGIVDLEALTPQEAIPIFCPWNGEQDPLALGQFLMLPFANRVKDGLFRFEHSEYHLLPNLHQEAYPIHGDAFQREWKVVHTSDEFACLRMEDGRIGPYRYHAEVFYQLHGQSVESSVNIKNTGETLPFGGGFHPWFFCDDKTRLKFSAQNFWVAGFDRIPTHAEPLGDDHQWNFSKGKTIPEEGIDNFFEQWTDGVAQIIQPSDKMVVTITAQDPLRHAMVYSKGADSGFVCFEPMSHLVNAHNDEEFSGLKILQRDETMKFSQIISYAHTNTEEESDP